MVNSQMCLINVAHEHSITKAGKNLNPALTNFMVRGAGDRESNDRGLRETNTPQASKLKINVTSWW